MKFWERVRRDLQSAVKEGADLFKVGTTALSVETKRMAKKGTLAMREETRRMVRLSKLRYQLYRENQKAQSLFAEIGGKVYDLASKDLEGFKADEGLKKLILETQQIEERVKTLESEIEGLSKKHQKKAA
jgi:hypothetical protein